MKFGCSLFGVSLNQKIRSILYSDTDECQEQNEGCLCDKELSNTNCTAGCNNVIGSFECYCGHGHILHSDERTCLQGKYISQKRAWNSPW